MARKKNLQELAEIQYGDKISNKSDYLMLAWAIRSLVISLDSEHCCPAQIYAKENGFKLGFLKLSSLRRSSKYYVT